MAKSIYQELTSKVAKFIAKGGLTDDEINTLCRIYYILQSYDYLVLSKMEEGEREKLESTIRNIEIF